MTFDPKALRADFPTLGREVHGKRLVYLDSAATSQTPRSVLDAMNHYYEHCNSNVHRGVYLLAEEATDLYENARTRVAEWLNWPREGVVFTKSTTESINLVAYSYARTFLGEGDALLATTMEHHANLVPWQQAAAASGFEVRYVPFDDEGFLDLDALDELLADGRVKLLAVTHMSNVLATVNEVADLSARVRAANPGAVVLADGAQAVPHLPVDAAELDVDFYAFSAHKMLGPTGIGVLLGRPEVLDRMPPFLSGGEMILDVTLEGSTWNELPYKFEAGTPNIAEAAGLHAAIDYLDTLGMKAVREHEIELTTQALAALADIPYVTVHGTQDATRRGGVISFTVDGVHPHDIGTILDREGVAVRVGHHCAKPLVRSLGAAATARASFYVYNDTDDIPPLVTGIQKAKEFFAR